MKFLLDANMPRSAASLLREHGHEVEDVRDTLPNGADDATVAAHAKAGQFILVTRDFDFADIAAQVNQALQSFASKSELLARLSGRLAIVETWRVRFRPPETAI